MSTNLKNGLISYWKLDEASGNAIDSHGANDATAINNPTSVAGKILTARRLVSTGQTAATSQYFTTPSNSSLQPRGSFTYSMWVNITSFVQASYGYVSKDNQLAGGREFFIGHFFQGQVPRFFVYDNDFSGVGVTATNFGAIPTGTWVHIVCWLDTIDNRLGISVNGVENTIPYTGDIIATNTPLYFGSRNGTGNFVNGSIDEIGYWKRALTAEERAELYANGNGLSYDGFTGNNRPLLMLQSNVISQFSGFPMIAKKKGEINAANEVELWTPVDTTTALWLDAADSSTLFDAVSGGTTPANGGDVARWEDKSGNARNAIQPSNKPQFITNSQNSQSVVRFVRASSTFLDMTQTAASIMQNKPYGAIYSVCKWNGVISADQTVLNISRNGNNTQLRLGLQLTLGGETQSFRAGARRLDTDAFTGVSSPNNTSYNILETRANYTGGNLRLMVNGTQADLVPLPSSGNTSDTQSDEVSIGRIGNNHLDADVGEILVFDYAVSQSENQKIEGYLAWKWGLQGNLPNDHPYKNSPPVKG